MNASILASALVLATVVAGTLAPGHAGSGRVQLQVLDDRLSLSLFAEHPMVATPIGIAIDQHDRVYVLESHTHLPPPDYRGPTTDRVTLLEDTSGDGLADRVTVSAEGFVDGMHMAFSPAGELYVVTARAVWALHDRDGDGVSEARTKVLDLVEPERVYPHAALLGIVFSADGWMYVTRGNTGGSSWVLVGSDGRRVEGYGDGGNVVRARADGSTLELVATGFWNPFAVEIDARGRLLVADNDPDSRGPNRLVHVVPGGEYGYHSLYGESGIHPYLAWNGELPGTLPYAVALGEAPSGLLDTSLAALPSDYASDLLCTIWEESRIVRIRTRAKGTSITGTTQPLIEGGPEFRPVALAATRDGRVYFTDWVLRRYPSHGQGRVWQLRTRPGLDRLAPRARFASPLPDPEAAPLRALAAAGEQGDTAALLAALVSPDPFVRSAAVTELARPKHRSHAVEATRDAAAAVRLGGLLALERARHEPADHIAGALLEDPDEHVRTAALAWIGRSGMVSLHTALDRALAGPVSPQLFETYLETVRFTTRAFVAARRARAAPSAKHLPRPLPARLVESIVEDAARPAQVRALALLHLDNPGAHVGLLMALAEREPDPVLRLEAVRSLAGTSTTEGAAVLARIAADAAAPTLLRAEALLALGGQPASFAPTAARLLDDHEFDVSVEAARYLRIYAGDEDVRVAAERRLRAAVRPDEGPLREQLALVLGSPGERPSSLNAWRTLGGAGGNPERGRRVFFSTHATCAVCHAAAGRGGALGPDLTNVGRSKTREQLVDAVLRPSADISPEWQGWYVRLATGEEHHGRQIDVGEDAIDLLLPSSGMTRFARHQVVDYGMMETSLMPEGLEALLTPSDLRDLLAFMEERR